MPPTRRGARGPCRPCWLLCSKTCLEIEIAERFDCVENVRAGAAGGSSPGAEPGLVAPAQDPAVSGQKTGGPLAHRVDTLVWSAHSDLHARPCAMPGLRPRERNSLAVTCGRHVAIGPCSHSFEGKRDASHGHQRPRPPTRGRGRLTGSVPCSSS